LTGVVREFDINRVTVGRFTYGGLDIRCWNQNNESLTIGSFCSIASGVKFVLGGNHRYDCISSFPFKQIARNENVIEAYSKGPIIVEDDVWIGIEAIILSGITIKRGAVIGAGAVVAKDVPPYAVVVGNPAKVIKYRFNQEMIDILLKIDYSKLTIEKIIELEKLLYSKADIDLVNTFIKRLSNSSID
jgi:acetyltransferase-like isoleucine patch superfamily enzyme